MDHANSEYWKELIGEPLLAPFLPREHVHWARPVAEALAVFLGGLPAARQAEILRDQAALPASTSAARRIGQLARSCAVLHKLGQVLARDQRLPLELRQHLHELESLPPTVPWDVIQRLVVQEIGAPEQHAITLTPPAIAEASVAVVIPFRSQSGAREGERRGVFKVLKPDIEERLEQELALLERVGSHLDERCEELGLPPLDYRETLEQIRDKLLDEIRLDVEQRHLAEARGLYAGDRHVHIPELWEPCTSRVTAMERIDGEKVADHGLNLGAESRRLGDLIIRSLVAKPLFSRAGNSLFHGDPHAGNLLLTREGRLAILDWSLAGRLGEQERGVIVQILRYAVTLQGGRMAALLAKLSPGTPVDREALRRVVEAGLRRVREGRLPGPSWLIGLLDDAVRLARLRVPSDLMLFRKSLHTLEGVAAEVGGGGSRIDEVLACEFLRHLAREWPQRWWSLPGSRNFATRLSNLDLAWTVWGSPATVARFWVGQGMDWYARWSGGDWGAEGSEYPGCSRHGAA